MTLIFNIEYRTSLGVKKSESLGSIPGTWQQPAQQSHPPAHCRRHSLDRGSGYPDSR